MHIEVIITIVSIAVTAIFWVATYAQRLKVIEEKAKERHLEYVARFDSYETQLQRVRDWRHDVVNPMLHRMQWELDLEDTRPVELPSVKGPKR